MVFLEKDRIPKKTVEALNAARKSMWRSRYTYSQCIINNGRSYSAPLSFVSSGKVQPTTATEQEEKSEHSHDEGPKAAGTKSNENVAKKKKKAAPELSEHELTSNYGIGHKLLKGMGWKGVSIHKEIINPY